MAFNAGYCDQHLETIGLAISDAWNGSYRLLTPDAILRNTDGSIHRCEDPHLWKTARGWHLLVHNMEGPQGVAAYAYSQDAISWTLSPHTPYNCTIVRPNGSTADAKGSGNRPQIVFSDDGKSTPLYAAFTASFPRASCPGHPQGAELLWVESGS